MPLRRVLRALGALAIGAATACSSHLPDIPANASLGPSALPTPRVEPNAAEPQILAMRFSALDVRRGQHWSGTFVTGTNVASVEVRTNLFSIDVPRRAFGFFTFTLDVLDAPSIFIRSYSLRVIARNSAGHPYEEDLPFRLR
jgi:hypothetical protein